MTFTTVRSFGLALSLTACGVVASSAVPARVHAQAQGFPRIQVTAGRSTVISTDFDITRIAVTNPAIADALAVQPREARRERNEGRDRSDRGGRRDHREDREPPVIGMGDHVPEFLLRPSRRAS